MSQIKISPQSKSFAILCGVAVVGIYVCLFLLHYVNEPMGNALYSSSKQASQVIYHVPVATPTPVETMDTSTWKTYTNPKYGFSFMYEPDWKVLSATKQKGFDVIQVDPGKKFYNIKIYISPTEYNAVGGLPSTQEAIGGATATNVQDLLFAVKNSSYYFTFDIGQSLSLKPQFDALVRSVSFQ